MNEKIEVVQYVSKMYRDVKLQMKEGERPQAKKYMLDREAEFVSYIDQIVSLLPREYELIIRYDFLEEREKKWWQKYFKKSTYYRKKSKAIEAFVDCVTL